MTVLKAPFPLRAGGSRERLLSSGERSPPTVARREGKVQQPIGNVLLLSNGASRRADRDHTSVASRGSGRTLSCMMSAMLDDEAAKPLLQAGWKRNGGALVW